MKKILLSLAMILVVGVAAVGLTTAFYNDTETSADNIFVAGSIDLKVDHEKQTYNGMNCETCELEMFSGDGQNDVTDASDNATYTGVLPKDAVLVASPHQNWATHPIAKWIWVDSSTSPEDAGNQDVEYTFERDFYWNGVPGAVNFLMSLASDNGYAIYVNDVELVNKLADEYNYNATIQPLNGLETQFKDALVLGSNTLKIVVRNHAQVNGTPSSNPGGLLYYLSIVNDDCQNDYGFQQACRLWNAKDLVEGDSFFNFADIKPADYGTNLISLHVSSNDAFACLIPNHIEDNENDLVEPESTAGDVTLTEGELEDTLEFMLWEDNGDGVYQDTETVLVPAGTTLSQVQTQMTELSLSGNGAPLYIGLAWCAGDQSVPFESSTIECDGNGMTNVAQTDSLSAWLTAYAVQQRNNDGFSCDDVVLEPQS